MRPELVRRMQTLRQHFHGKRCYAQSSSSSLDVPFYGLPRPARAEHESNGVFGRIAFAIKQAAIALNDPTRADAVAAVGEATGHIALSRLHSIMLQHDTGRLILQERPIVTKATIPYETLIKSAPDNFFDIDENDTNITFGQAYGAYIKHHDFDPDERSDVKYIYDDTEDKSLAYIMLRYRQCHDFWHALTGLPPTVPGELALKWLELFQTGMPLAAFSATVAPLTLPYKEQQVLWNIYLPWAVQISRALPFGTLMNVYYEKEWETPLHEMRQRLHIQPAPRNVEGN